jgi:hypothetical protein
MRCPPLMVPCLSAFSQLAESGTLRAMSWNSATVLTSDGGGYRTEVSLASNSRQAHFLH